MAEQELKGTEAAAEAEAVDLDEFGTLLEKDFRVKEQDDSAKLHELVANLALAAREKAGSATISGNAVRSIKSLIAGIDELLTTQMNQVLHAPEIRRMEGSWRGLHYLVNNTETDTMLKIRVLNISKKDLAKTLKKFKGAAWDQSPLFKKLYEEEFGQFGGELLTAPGIG